MSEATQIRPVEWGRLHERGTAAAGEGDPGVVLIHDVWGPSQHSLDLAADLAQEGFAVLEIDLYRSLRERPGFAIEAPGPFILSLSDPEILGDIEAAGAWLQNEIVSGRPVGVMGVCMGGTYASLAACRPGVFAAAAPFYGILSYDEGLISAEGEPRNRERKPQSPIEAAGNLRIPMLAAFGSEDDFIPEVHRVQFEAALRGAESSSVVRVYPGAGHAFLNRTRTEAYREEASRAAWAETIPFLKGALG